MDRRSTTGTFTTSAATKAALFERTPLNARGSATHNVDVYAANQHKCSGDWESWREREREREKQKNDNPKTHLRRVGRAGRGGGSI